MQQGHHELVPGTMVLTYPQYDIYHNYEGSSLVA